MLGKLIDLTMGLNNRQRVTIEILGDFREEYNLLKENLVSVQIKKHRKKRSLDANAYFHVLCNQIAVRKGLGEDEQKRELVCEHGVPATDDDGEIIGFKLPSSVKAFTFYPYVKWYETVYEDGKEYYCYIAYKRSSEMDSAEMARLIDGTVREAQELGIDTTEDSYDKEN